MQLTGWSANADQQLSQIGFGIETVSLAESIRVYIAAARSPPASDPGSPDRKPDTEASHGISDGKIRNPQKACEGSILSMRSMFCSGVELSSPT